MLLTPKRGGRVVRLVLGLWALSACMARPVRAADVRWLDEIKLGVLAHDTGLLGLAHQVEPGVDVNLEVLWPTPAFLRALWAPRPHLGVSVNTAGATDYGYLGLTWRGRPWRPVFPLPEGFFVAGSLGGAIQDGYLDTAPPHRKRLGSRLQFRYSVEAGYQLTPVWSVSVMLDHLSNGHLVSHNASLNNLGVRIGVTL